MPETSDHPTPALVRVGFVCFAGGLLAVVVIMALFAGGAHDLPLWLNLLAMLAPAGFGIGLIGLFVEARASRPATRATRFSAAANPEGSIR